MSCAKVVFLVLNVILWLTGAIFLGIGVWFWVDSGFASYIVSFIQELDGFNKTFSVQTVAILFVVIGIIVFIVGFLGCCGAFWEIKWLLGIFIFLLAVVLIIELAAAILAAVYRNELVDRVELAGTDYITKNYMNPDLDSHDSDVAFNYIQFKWKCCGIVGPTDYKGSAFEQLSIKSMNELVPGYCCVMNHGYVYSASSLSLKNVANCNFEANTCFDDTCLESAIDLHVTGCEDSIIEWVKDYLPVFMGIGLGIFFVQLGVLITASWVCRNMRKSSRGRMARGASEMKDDEDDDGKEYEMHE